MFAHEWVVFLPYWVIGLGAIAVLLVGVLPVRRPHSMAYGLTLSVLVLALLLDVAVFGQAPLAVGGLSIDEVALKFNVLAILCAFGALTLARGYRPLAGEVSEAFCGLVLFITLGMFLLIAAHDLLTAFLGLELMAVPLFGLVAWTPNRRGAVEGGIKYAVLSGLAAAFFLYGMALIYAGSGTLSLALFAQGLSDSHSVPMLMTVGLIMLLVGIGFELALVPFHMWVADVYEGAPVPVTALIGTVTKVAMLVFLIHLLSSLPVLTLQVLTPILTVLAVLSMVVGNVLALRQRNLLRLLGYSTIAHIGYVLAALSCLPESGGRAALYYAIAYAVMNMAVFAVVAVLQASTQGGGLIDHYRGLGRRYPWLGVALVIGVLSLAGIPPTAGFFAKLFVLLALFNAGHVVLAVVLVLATAASFYYYLRVLLVFFQEDRPPEQKVVLTAPLDTWLILGVAGVLTVVIGVWAQVFF